MTAVISSGAVLGPVAAALSIVVLLVTARRTDDPYVRLARHDRRAARRRHLKELP